MVFTFYEKHIIWPLLHSWGFSTNYLEIPYMGSVIYSFRVNRKEFNFILTFLVFFIKCFFLNQKVFFNVNYSNLRLEIKVKKKNKKFFFYFFFLNFLYNFFIKKIYLNKKVNNVGRKGSNLVLFSTSKFFLCMSEIFNIGFFFFQKNDMIFHVYNLFQHVFYSSRSLSFNLTVFVNVRLKHKFNYLHNKVSLFYCFNK